MSGIGKNFLEDFVSEEPENKVDTTLQDENIDAEKKSDVNVDNEDKPEPIVDAEKTDDAIPGKEVDETKKPVEDKPSEINDDAVKQYLKEKVGLELEDLQSLKAKKDSPLEGLSEEALAFIKFNKETNRGIDDYLETRKDYNKVSPLEIAREKAILLSNGQLSKEDVDTYLERKLNIDLTNQDSLDKFDLIELSNYSKDFLESKIENQKKYAAPKKSENPLEDNYVKLEDGTLMDRKVLEQRQVLHKKFLEENQKASDQIKPIKLSFSFDNNGEKIPMEVEYEPSKEDKLKTLSNVNDLDKMFNDTYKTEDGGIDSVKLQTDELWRDESTRAKMLKSFADKITAQVLEMVSEEDLNFKVNSKQIPGSKTSGKNVPIPGTQSGLSVKFFD